MWEALVVIAEYAQVPSQQGREGGSGDDGDTFQNQTDQSTCKPSCGSPPRACSPPTYHKGTHYPPVHYASQLQQLRQLCSFVEAGAGEHGEWEFAHLFPHPSILYGLGSATHANRQRCEAFARPCLPRALRECASFDRLLSTIAFYRVIERWIPVSEWQESTVRAL